MNETVIGILGIILVLGVLAGIAYALDRRSKVKGNLFTGKPTRTTRGIAIVLGLLFGAIFINELLQSNLIHFLWPILAVALLGYGLGAGRFLGILQGEGNSVRSAQESPTDEQPKAGTRRLFYTSMGLLVGGVLLIGLGGLYNSSLLATIGIIVFLGAMVAGWYWWLRKILL